MIKAPVLLITYNRPDTTQKVFDGIKRTMPSRLYVFNDGPRLGNVEDLKAREEIKGIINQVDWECEVFRNFSEINLGCGLGVSGAITWAFEKEYRLIILEDDCVPSIHFFDFCNYCLEKYKNNDQIVHVAGNNYTESHNYSREDYLFSKYGHIWGWATWKRAWSHFDFEMKDWPYIRDNKKLNDFFNLKREVLYFEEQFDSYYYDKNLPWGLRWFFTRIKINGLSIVPRINLIKNIGYIGTYSNTEYKYDVDLNANFIVTNEPLSVLCNTQYDIYHFKNHINKKTKRYLFIRVYRKLKKKVNALLKLL